MCRSSSNYHTAVCNILKHPFIPSSGLILTNLQHILDLNLSPTGRSSLISSRFASWVHHHRGDPSQSVATSEDDLQGVLDTNEVRFGLGLFPGANLSWPGLWWERPRRTHSQSRFVWSCPDTRLRLSPWTTWPARWRNTPWAVGIKQTCIRHTGGRDILRSGATLCWDVSRAWSEEQTRIWKWEEQFHVVLLRNTHSLYGVAVASRLQISQRSFLLLPQLWIGLVRGQTQRAHLQIDAFFSHQTNKQQQVVWEGLKPDRDVRAPRFRYRIWKQSSAISHQSRRLNFLPPPALNPKGQRRILE